MMEQKYKRFVTDGLMKDAHFDNILNAMDNAGVEYKLVETSIVVAGKKMNTRTIKLPVGNRKNLNLAKRTMKPFWMLQ